MIAVYGVGLVAPLGWGWAIVVWAYAFAWFLVTDPVKLLAYHILEPATPEAKPVREPAAGAVVQPA